MAIVDPVGQRERVPDGKYAGEPKGTWGIRSLRAAKSAAVNELLDLDQVMKQLNELIRQSIVKSLREQGGEEMVLQDDLEKLFAKLEQEVPDFQKWKYGLSDMAPYRKDIDAITDRWLQQVHPEDWSAIQETWDTLEKQQERAYGKNARRQTYRMNQEKDLYKRCGNAVLQTLRSAEQEKRKANRTEQSLKYQKRGYRIPHFRIRRLGRYFEDSYRHYKNLAAYDRAQRQAQWNQQQQLQEEEAHVHEAVWLENGPE